MAYTAEQIDGLAQSYGEWQQKCSDLIDRYFSRAYIHERSRTLVMHGVIRRLRTIERCMSQVYNLVPPEETGPARDDITDAGIYLQAFIINVFGAIDNLARLWVWEKGVLTTKGKLLPPSWIGLTPDHKLVRESLSDGFQEHLANSDGWFEYLENYRHALAHRIPLYIPPKRLDEAAAAEYQRLEEEQHVALKAGDFDKFDELFVEQGNLGVFEPLMMHSFGPTADDGRPVLFHGQMINDLATLVEIGNRMLDELETLA